jgi:cation transport ATPase
MSCSIFEFGEISMKTIFKTPVNAAWYAGFCAAVFALAASTAAAKTTVLSVNGMVCSFCAQGIEKRLSALPQTHAVFVDLKKKIVAVEAKTGMSLDRAVLEREIVDAGYDVTKVEELERSVAEVKAASLSAWLSLFTSTGTLVCCALPALMVSLGAGAALAGLVSAVPGLILFSEYKEWVFGVGTVMLALGGVAQWRSRFAPCPIDPARRDACVKTRRVSAWVYGASVAGLSLCHAKTPLCQPRRAPNDGLKRDPLRQP